MEGSCGVVRAYSSELGFGSDFQNRCTIPYKNHISVNSANSPIELIDNSDNDEFPGFTLSPHLNGSSIMTLPSIAYPPAVHPPTVCPPLPHTTSCPPAAHPPTAYAPLPHTTSRPPPTHPP